MKKSKSTEQIRSMITARAKREVIKSQDLLGSGSTKLNLALTGRTKGAYAKGKYIVIAGTTDALKTWLGLSALAEATIDPAFDDYRLVYDPVEDGASMDKAFFFGKRLKKRIEPLHGTRDEPDTSETIEDLYDGIERLEKDGRPFVLVVDSETALDSRADQRRRAKQQAARAAGEKESGSFNDEKQKIHSRRLRGVRNRLRKSGSIIIFIVQLRQSIGFGAQFEPYYQPGGTAVSYYADARYWTFVAKQLKVKFGLTSSKKKSRHVGSRVAVKVKRTRFTGKKHNTFITIYHDSGIDDVGDNIDYLVEEGWWKKVKGIVYAKEFNKRMRREDLIRYVENRNREQDLRGVVKACWKKIEEAVAVKRKSRYA